ncbi:MAG: L-rhamnose isomerase [Melioribacteraceae bacterium]|nr:L-rhamnose isomerase [Melioribacteraceae bacterium]
MNEKIVGIGLKSLEHEFGKEIVENAIKSVEKFKVEIPSWVFGEFGGGRFGDYMPPGFARNVFEKLDDAAFINKLTDAVSSIATHVLWEFSDDGETVSLKKTETVLAAANKNNLKLGSVSPTYFLKGSHKGSLSANNNEIRRKFVDQTIMAAEIAEKFASNLITLWLPDGSNYPGQIELSDAIDNTRKSLREISSQISKDVKCLIEYKVFEPGTYSTVLSDWGSAYLMAKEFGSNAGVLIDLGHHHHGTNIEQIIARLINDGISAGIHINTRYAADDDHSAEPNSEMARIFYELVKGNTFEGENKWEIMIDQCSVRENRMHAILHTIDTLQSCLAKAMLVDSERLRELQKDDEVILANRFFNNALLNADVRPIVAAARLNKNLPVNPFEEFIKSGYQQKIEEERK